MIMFLDDYLLSHGVKCNETMNYLVKNGMVTVNGKVVTYSRLPLEESDKIEVIKEDYKDVPASYWKLKAIHESINLIQKGDFILDIESPDGGFPMFAARNGANLSMITIKDDLDFLKSDGVEIIKKNIVREDILGVLSSKFDIVIIELNFDILKIIQIVEKIRNYIGSRGKLLMFIPDKGRENIKELADDMLLKQK